MRKFAIYGKGGIGKSTTTANLSAALSMMGKKVVQVGCDPKADSTLNLLHGHPVTPVMDYYREHTEGPDFDHIGREGFGGVFCIETGGPTPGLGCAGRGIIATFSLLEDLGLFEKYEPDVVLYDVLGDVVCGGFAAPIREGYAEQVLIVTSANFADRSYAKVRGILLNRRNVPDEEAKVRAFAEKAHLSIVGDIPRSDDINRYEDLGQTVIEGDPDLPISHIFLDLAQKLLQDKE